MLEQTGAGKEIEVMQGNIELKVNTGNPKLGNISLMVKVHLFPVHHSYLVIRQGLYTYNSTLGIDIAGRRST